MSNTVVMSPVADQPVLTREVSWGAILAGSVTALVTQVVVNLAGVGIGLAGAAPGSDQSATTLTTGAGVWLVASGVVASLAGGVVAGRMAGARGMRTAGLHGLVSWAVTTLVVLYLLSSAVGGVVGGAFGALSSTLGGAGRAAGGAVQTAVAGAAPSLAQAANPLDTIEKTVREQTGGQDPQALRDAAAQAVRAMLSGDQAERQQAADRAAEALAKAQNIPVDQAKQQVQQYQAQYEQTVAAARQKVEAATEATRSAATKAAFLAFVSLLLGAIAAFVGGRIGTPKGAAVLQP
jgi:hypothetical protein